MLWVQFDLESWVAGVTGGPTFCLHLGPIKMHWVPKGGQLYRDFSSIETKKGDGNG